MVADPVQTHVVKTWDHTAPLLGGRFTPQAAHFYAGGQDHKIIRWDTASGEKSEFAGHASWVRGFAFSADGTVMVSFGWDGRLIWWNLAAEPPTPIRTVEAHHGWIRQAVISPEGNLLATCGNDLKVKLWNFADGSLVREMTGHQRHIYNLAFHPEGKQLVSGDLLARFIHWDVMTGQQVREFKIESLSKYDPGFMADYGGPYSLSFHPAGQRLLAGGITNVTNAFAGIGNPILVELDWETGKEAITHLCNPAPNGTIQGAAFHPDGFLIGTVGGGGGGWTYFWKLDSKEEFQKLNLGSPARDLSLHHDGVQFAVPCHDGKVRLCKMGPKA